VARRWSGGRGFSLIALALLAEARRLEQSEKYEESAETVVRFLKETRESELAPKMRLGLATLYEKACNPEKARKAWEAVLGEDDPGEKGRVVSGSAPAMRVVRSGLCASAQPMSRATSPRRA